jgi:hypothetical protein
MFQTRLIAFLMQGSAVATAGMIWVCQTYWPNPPQWAIGLLVFLAFATGFFCNAWYMLARYRHELTPEVMS